MVSPNLFLKMNERLHFQNSQGEGSLVVMHGSNTCDGAPAPVSAFCSCLPQCISAKRLLVNFSDDAPLAQGVNFQV